MDVNAISEIFATTYNPDPNARLQAELQLRKIGDQEGLLPALMQLIASENVDPTVRQACTVFLKNKVIKHWAAEGSRISSRHYVIADNDKQALKENFLQLIIAAPSRATRVHLASALNRMISQDFPAKWPGLLENVQRLLNNGETREMMAGCVALLEIVRTFRYRQSNADILVKVIEATFPTVVLLGKNLMTAAAAPASQQQAEEIPYLLHLILKSYKCTLVLNLSAHQKTSGSIVNWGQLLFAVISFQVPKELLPEDEEEREHSEWWKAKKWAYGTLDRLFHRYGNPSQLPSTMQQEYGQFAEHFTTVFAPEIIKSYLQQIDLYITGQSWVSRKCQYLIFQFFSECIKSKATWLLLKPHAETLVTKFVFPQLSFSQAKNELWKHDPVEYIRTVLDEYEDYSSPISSATSFLVGLAKTRAKHIFLPILNFINQVLDNNPSPAQKFGALNMTTALSPFIMRNSAVKPAMEQFVVRHVIPELSSQEPFLRAIACETACTLEKFGLQWSKEENLLALFNGVLRAIDDPELPVRIHAALALMEMVQQHPPVTDAVSKMVGKLIQDLLKLSDETDLDVLNHLMEVMVEQYTTELLPVASQLTARLCHTYNRLLQEANANVDTAPNAPEEEKAPDDDKTFAAMGVAKTIGTIVSSVDSSPEILNELQQVIIPIISYTLETKSIDLFDNVYDLVDSLTFNLRSISPQMWPIFEQTYRLFKSDAIDFLDEMLPALDNFLSYGKDVFISRPDYVEKVLDIYVTAMTSDQLGEADRVDGCKLAESMLLNLRGHIDVALPTIINTAFKTLETQTDTKSLKLANLEVLINAVLYNAPAALHLMQNQGSNKLQQFFKQWFDLLKDDLYLPRVHDKKLSILAMCALLTLDGHQVPTSLQEGWTGIVNSILTTFKSLPAAIANRNKMIEKANADDDDGDNSELGLGEVDDHDVGDEDVWDDDSQYIEMLAQEGARLRARAENRAATTSAPADNDDDDDSNDDDDDDDMDEDLGFISPLENIDPYVTFKHALQGFQEKNPQIYQASTTSLSVENQTILMEVMAIAERAESS